MFQFPGFALKTLCVQELSTCLTRLETAMQSTVGYQVGCPIRRSTDQSLFSAPHGLSQSTTSFIASCRQGIHQTPLLRLIRSRRRRTVCAASGLPPPFAKAGSRTRQLAARILSSRRAPSADGATGFGQCHLDLGKTILGVRPRLALPRDAWAPGCSCAEDPQGSLPFLSLHDIKPPGPRRTRKRAKRICHVRAPPPMVEATGIEPVTLCLQSRCSPS